MYNVEDLYVSLYYELLEGVVNNRWGGKSKQFTKVFSVNIFHYMYTPVTVLVLLKPQAPASVYIIHTVYRAGATGQVGPVLAGPIFMRKRGRDKLCTNAVCIYMH